MIVLSNPGLSCLHVLPHSFFHSVQVLDRLNCLRVIAFSHVIPRVLNVVLALLVVSSEKLCLFGRSMDCVIVRELCKG